MANAQLLRFDTDVRQGIQYITAWIHKQAGIRGIELDDIKWNKCSEADKYCAEVRITYEGNIAEQRFTADHLLHFKPSDRMKKKALSDVVAKVESLFLRLGQ